jgi:hypothetical protein
VWTVTLAVRMFDLERFSVKAQEELCADFGATLNPPPQVCFGAIGVLGQGYYWLIPACGTCKQQPRGIVVPCVRSA